MSNTTTVDGNAPTAGDAEMDNVNTIALDAGRWFYNEAGIVIYKIN
jgi:hypothetical protein